MHILYNNIDNIIYSYLYIYILYIDVIYIHIVNYVPYTYICSEMIRKYTVHIVYIHVTSAGKSVHIVMARNKVFKILLMSELCFHRFGCFYCVPIYVFGFNNKQCASDQKGFTFVKLLSQLFSSADEALNDKTCLLLLRDGSLGTPHTLCSSI